MFLCFTDAFDNHVFWYLFRSLGTVTNESQLSSDLVHPLAAIHRLPHQIRHILLSGTISFGSFSFLANNTITFTCPCWGFSFKFFSNYFQFYIISQITRLGRKLCVSFHLAWTIHLYWIFYLTTRPQVCSLAVGWPSWYTLICLLGQVQGSYRSWATIFTDFFQTFWDELCLWWKT